ncbi:hypothetical protein FRC11_010283, partial [Ceratobasidium sp. 423]
LELPRPLPALGTIAALQECPPPPRLLSTSMDDHCASNDSGIALGRKEWLVESVPAHTRLSRNTIQNELMVVTGREDKDRNV